MLKTVGQLIEWLEKHPRNAEFAFNMTKEQLALFMDDEGEPFVSVEVDCYDEIEVYGTTGE